MSSSDRRSAARRRVWGRGPVILRFEPLEGRQLLSVTGDAVDPVATPAAVDDATPTSAEDAAAATSSATATTAGNPDEVTPLSTVAETEAPDPSRVYLTTTAPLPQDPTAPQPDLVLGHFTATSSLDWGQRFSASGVLRNDGPGTAPAGVKVDVYASTRTSLVPSSVYLGTVAIAEPIAPGAQVPFTADLEAPPRPITGLGRSPSYYLVPKVDLDNQLKETVETNNGGTAGSPASLVTVAAAPQAKLVATNFAAVPLNGKVDWGGTLQVTARIANQSATAPAPATRARLVLVPIGEPPESPNALTVGDLFFPSIAPNGASARQGTIYLPSDPPSTLEGKTQITLALVPDADYLTRPRLTATPVLGEGLDQVALAFPNAPPAPPPDTRPDLTVTSVQPLSQALVWSESFQVKATVANSGTSDAAPVRVRFLLVDANHPGESPLALADTVLPKLQAGFQQEITQTIELSGKLPQGRDPSQIAGRIIVQMDPERAVDQKSTSNDLLTSSPVTIKLLNRQDVVSPTPAEPAPATSTAPKPPTPTPTTPTPTTPPPTTPPPTANPTPQPSTNPRHGRAALLAQLRLARQQARANRRVNKPLPVRLRVANPALRIVAGEQHQAQTRRGPHAPRFSA